MTLDLKILKIIKNDFILFVPFSVGDFSSIDRMKTAVDDYMAALNTVDKYELDMLYTLNNFDESYSSKMEMVSTFLSDNLFEGVHKF